MKRANRGFTLIELVVVMSLFMLVLGVTVSIFISVIRQQKRVLVEQELLTQVQHAKEYITSNLQTAKKDSAGACLVDRAGRHYRFWYLLTRYNETAKTYEGIKFIDEQGNCQEIFFDVATKSLKVSHNAQMPQDILSPESPLTRVVFMVNGDNELYGAAESDRLQPRVTTVIAADTPGNGQAQEKRFQFTVSKPQ